MIRAAQKKPTQLVLPSPGNRKILPQKATENHWLVYLLVVSPVLFRATRYAISMATSGRAEPLSILEIGLVLAVLYQVFTRWLMQRKPPFVFCRSDVYVFLFVLAAGISVIALLYRPVNHSESLKSFARLLEYVTLYAIISTNIPSWQAIRKLMICLVGCGVAVSAFAILQYMMGPVAATRFFPWGTWWAAIDVEASAFRAYSFFLNPIYVSAYVVVVWAINLGLVMSERGGKYRTLYMTALLLNSVGLLINFSRTGLVALPVTLLVFAKERARLTIAGGLAVLLIASYLIPGELRARVFLEERESRESIFARLDRYRESLGVYAEHPLWGVGFGNYQSYFVGGSAATVEGAGYANPTLGDYNRFEWLRRNSAFTAENTFLQYAGEMGTPGVIAFLALLVHFLTLCWRSRKKTVASDTWVLGLFAGLLGFLICSMFATLTAVEMNAFFWILLGISKALWLRRPRPQLEVRRI